VLNNSIGAGTGPDDTQPRESCAPVVATLYAKRQAGWQA